LLEGNTIRIQGRVYKYSKSRTIPPGVKTLTVKRDTLGNLWLYFVVQAEINPDHQTMTGHSAGFDFGLKTFLTTSGPEGTPQAITSPLYYRQALDQLRQAQRQLSSKVKRSHNWQKAKATAARIYQRVVNRRRDWFFKLAHELTERYDSLFFEDLAMRGMQRMWGRKIGDLARSEFMGILAYVASIKGKVVHLVSRFFPSSKSCAACGHLQTLHLSARRWVCDSCGVIHDRDHNAALNILREGASSLGLGDVRPPLVAIAV
jgi:putative transposase